MITNFNRQTEGFKIAFLIMLDFQRNDTQTLGQLINNLNKSSTFSYDVTKELELILRNTFAHQTYWFEKGELFYCENVSFQNINSINLGTLMQKAKRQNIIFQVFLRVFAEKIKDGFFSDI